MIEARLKQLGITLPAVAIPAANYVPYKRVGNLLVISGQLPLKDGAMAHSGKATPARLEEAQAAAKLCAINLLANVAAACEGDWSRVETCVRLGVFVNAESGFTDAHKVANGASDFIVEVLGDAGKHARAAVSVSELPLGALVEVDGMFWLK